MARWLRALVALPEDSGSSSSTEMVAHKSSATPGPKDLTPSLLTPDTRVVQLNTHTHKIKQIHLSKKFKQKNKLAAAAQACDVSPWEAVT